MVLLLLTALVLLLVRALVHAVRLDGYGHAEPPRSHPSEPHRPPVP